MHPLGFHVTFRLVDSRVIAPDAALQRRLARSVLAVARPFRLLAFRCADTHGHLLLVEPEPRAREAARRVLIGIRRSLGLPVRFSPAHLEPVRSQRHLENAFLYVLRQDARHGFGHDPYHEASNLPDMLGLRVTGAWTTEHVRRALPRVRRPALLAALGAPDLDDRPRSFAALAEAAAAAMALPDLSGRGAEAVAARRAAVHVARAHVPAGEVGTLLGCSAKTVRRLAAQQADRALVQAVDGQLRLRGEAPGPPGYLAEPAPEAYRSAAASEE